MVRSAAHLVSCSWRSSADGGTVWSVCLFNKRVCVKKWRDLQQTEAWISGGFCCRDVWTPETVAAGIMAALNVHLTVSGPSAALRALGRRNTFLAIRRKKKVELRQKRLECDADELKINRCLEKAWKLRLQAERLKENVTNADAFSEH